MSKLLQSASEIFLQLAAAYEQDKQENEFKLDTRFLELEEKQGRRFAHLEDRVDRAEVVAAENREAIKATLEAILSRL
jgi:hypothetical protein